MGGGWRGRWPLAVGCLGWMVPCRLLKSDGGGAFIALLYQCNWIIPVRQRTADFKLLLYRTAVAPQRTADPNHQKGYQTES